MSSPVRPVSFESYVINSSSPELPSLGELFRKSPKKAPLRSGSNAAPIPTTARSTFATAADILREAPEIDIETEQITQSPPRKAKSTKRPRPKARQAKEHQNTTTETLLSPKDKPWQKFKSYNSTPEDGQATIPKGRVTKATAADKNKEEKKKKKKMEIVSKHFATEEGLETNPSVRRRSTTPVELPPLESAMARRNDWTPPPVNNVSIHGPGSDDRELISSAERPANSKEVFESLFDDYACRTVEAESRASDQAPELMDEVLKKRKRLELPSTNDEKPGPSRISSPTKAPAVKKKVRTITDLATAPYAAPVIPEIDLLAPASKDSLLKYFDTDGHVKALVERQAAAIEIVNSKAKKPTARSKKKKKDGTLENPILLSPNSALKQSINQDFVFGTSSQLVLEESPGVLRDLQIAIQASNKLDDDPFASSPTSRPAGSKGLWHAGARSSDGNLLNAEVVKLIRNPRKALGDQEPSRATSGIPTKLQSSEEDFVDIEDICSSSPRPDSRSNDSVSQILPSQQKASGSTTTKAAAASSLSVREPAMPRKDAAATPPPKYELFTDSQLAKQVTSYGFKPVKKREAMIALLSQCWESRHPGSARSLPSFGPTASLSTSATLNAPSRVSPKKTQVSTSTLSEPVRKPRGRPRKDSQATAVATKTSSVPEAMRPSAEKRRPQLKKSTTRASDLAVDDNAVDGVPADESKPVTPSKRKTSVREAIEIADSENDDSSSPSPQSSPEHVFSPPPLLDISMSEEGDMSLNLSPSDQETVLFSQITKAVTSAPRSKDANSPSWHEKMLLYDPIVLEDLTAWLNAGELTRVGYDEEVSPGDVKRWCESKSVICLWKVNLHGRERKRY